MFEKAIIFHHKTLIREQSLGGIFFFKEGKISHKVTYNRRLVGDVPRTLYISSWERASRQKYVYRVCVNLSLPLS